jgi:hypothetical protein
MTANALRSKSVRGGARYCGLVEQCPIPRAFTETSAEGEYAHRCVPSCMRRVSGIGRLVTAAGGRSGPPRPRVSGRGDSATLRRARRPPATRGRAPGRACRRSRPDVIDDEWPANGRGRRAAPRGRVWAHPTREDVNYLEGAAAERWTESEVGAISRFRERIGSGIRPTRDNDALDEPYKRLVRPAQALSTIACRSQRDADCVIARGR